MAIIMLWNSSQYWQNGQNRFISKDGETDPYDQRFSISGGGTGRQFYINGKGSGFISGNQARARIKSSAYSTQIELTVLWNSSIGSMSLRFRDRHNMASPDANKFGGYIVVIDTSGNTLRFYRETYHDTNVDLTPATDALPFTLTAGNVYHIKARCYDNAAHTNVILKCEIDSGAGYVLEGTATDTTPTTAALNSVLFNTESFNMIRVNGTSVKDVELRDVRILDLRDNYTET